MNLTEEDRGIYERDDGEFNEDLWFLYDEDDVLDKPRYSFESMLNNTLNNTKKDEL